MVQSKYMLTNKHYYFQIYENFCKGLFKDRIKISDSKKYVPQGMKCEFKLCLYQLRTKFR